MLNHYAVYMKLILQSNYTSIKKKKSLWDKYHPHFTKKDTSLEMVILPKPIISKTDSKTLDSKSRPL